MSTYSYDMCLLRLAQRRTEGKSRHDYLIRVASVALLEDIPFERFATDVAQVMGRPLQHGEARNAWDSAARDMGKAPPAKTRRKKVEPLPVAAVFISKARFEDLEAISPIPLAGLDDRERQSLFFRHTFNPGEKIYVGPKLARAETQPAFIKTAEEWAERGSNDELMCMNPVSGEPALAGSTGKESYRCDNNVVNPRHLLYECDEGTLEQQAGLLIRMLGAWGIRSITWSGGKSLHALCDAERVRFEELSLHRADRSCGNLSRLTRTPSAIRRDPINIQKLIYLGVPA